MCQAKAGDLCGSKGYDLISTGSDQELLQTLTEVLATHLQQTPYQEACI